jgi:hypothetical protein
MSEITPTLTARKGAKDARGHISSVLASLEETAIQPEAEFMNVQFI